MQRAEHNEGMLATLEELALHQQHLEKIEGLHKICRHLKILLLQNNLISRIENLHRLKELDYLNLALNNIAKVQNLQRCESLRKLDLTMNFVPASGLLCIHSLQANLLLEEVYLMGNPCSDWPDYRAYVIAAVPQLKKLDGTEIRPSERIAAQQAFTRMQASLRAHVIAEGGDPDEAATAEDDGLDYDSDAEVEDPGFTDTDGEFKRPWCPATRIIEHRENERIELEQAEKKKAGQSHLFTDGRREQAVRRDTFPEVTDGERMYQKNEGQWEFTLEESADGQALILDVHVGKFLDTSLIKADVQPRWARLLVKGRLLQLQLPCEVLPDSSMAQRSKITGSLALTMPKENPEAAVTDMSLVRRRAGTGAESEGRADRSTAKGAASGRKTDRVVSQHAKLAVERENVSVANIVREKGDAVGPGLKEVRRAQLTFSNDSDDDEIPPL